MATIVIDPGHYGGYNAGVCPGYYEGNTMLKLAQYLGPELEALGAKVVYTRTTNDQNPTLSQRGATVPNADLFISLHSDASDDPNVEGVTSYYSVKLPQTEPFATDIGKAVSDVMQNTFRGSIARQSTTSPNTDYLGVLRAATAVGVKNAFLIEHGFHTNMKDCLTLSDDQKLQQIAAAQAAVIAKHLNLTAAPSTPTIPTPPAQEALNCRFTYTVQPGDSLYSIGHKFGIPWQNVATTNNINSPYSLSIGQNITIPGDGAATYYTVQPGDTLYTIGQKYGFPWQNIAIANGLTTPYQIYVGQQIIIPQTCHIYYTVQNGDSLYSIGAKFGVPWENIAIVNNLTYPYTIMPGTTLLIPLPMM